MDIWSSIILGIIQGLTEFIPVSSTAHLILANQLLPLSQPTDLHAFDTIIQAGTLLPLLIYFRADWAALLGGLLRVLKNRKVSRDAHERLAVLVAIGSIPAFVLGALLNKPIEALADVSEHPIGLVVIGGALVGVGVLMGWVDALARKKRTEEQLTEVDAVVVGVAQALALIPGVSRSGATITAGLLTGLTREAAARFSFLLSAPVLAGAVAFKLLKLAKAHEKMPGSEWVALGLGMVAAAVVGYASIAFLLRYLKQHSLAVFAWYRVVLGLFVIGLYVAPKLTHQDAARMMDTAPARSAARASGSAPAAGAGSGLPTRMVRQPAAFPAPTSLN